MPERRKIIRIEEEKCTGCGECIPNCPEGALQLVDGKARLVSDLFCDGLGACIGHCPTGAIEVEERVAEPYDERKVMENIARQGGNTIRAHLEHLKEHDAEGYYREAVAFLKERGIRIPAEGEGGASGGGKLLCGCPGSRVIDFAQTAEPEGKTGAHTGRQPSRLRHWPVQLTLVPPGAPYLKGADLLISADCVPFAYADFHKDYLRGRIVLVGCPKLDDLAAYREKLKAIFQQAEPASLTVLRMEVPCCGGISAAVIEARDEVLSELPAEVITVGVRGAILSETIAPSAEVGG